MNPVALVASIMVCALWGYTLGHWIWAAGMVSILIAGAAIKTKVFVSQKTWSRGGDLIFILLVVCGFWFYITRSSIQGSVALELLSVCPIVLFPKMIFLSFFRLDPDQIKTKKTQDGVEMARRYIEQERQTSKAYIDARPGLDFVNIFVLLTMLVCLIRLPQREAIIIGLIGLVLYTVLLQKKGQRGWGKVMATLLIALIPLTLAVGSGLSVQYMARNMEGEFAKFWRNKVGEGLFSSSFASTSIGSGGNLEAGGKLLYRVEWDRSKGYLKNGTFSQFIYTPQSSRWIVATQNNDVLLYANEDSVFELPSLKRFSPIQNSTKSGSGEKRGAIGRKEARIYTNLEKEKSTLALPVGTNEIFGLPLSRIEINSFSVVSTAGTNGFVKYAMYYTDDYKDQPDPEPEDLVVPLGLQNAVDSFIDEAKLRDLPADQVAKRLKEFFLANYKYTFDLNEAGTKTGRSLQSFLLRDRRGHCEFFATATSLVFRRLGIASRYETGFLVDEYQADEKLFWVRSRDAHAWNSYWTGTGWESVDNTVPGQGDLEAQDASTIGDFFTRLQYKIDTFDAQEFSKSINKNWLLGLVALFSLILIYRIKKAKKSRVLVKDKTMILAEKLTELLEKKLMTLRSSRVSGPEFWLNCAQTIEQKGFIELAQKLTKLSHIRHQILFEARSEDTAETEKILSSFESLSGIVVKELAKTKFE